MNQKLPKLSPRLNAAYKMCIPRAEVWDICCDHGYLGLKALLRNQSPKVYLVDKSNRVTDRLKEDLGDMSNNLEVLAQAGQDIDVSIISGTAVIMGVGSQTIIDILDSWFNQKPVSQWKLQRLILSSHAKLKKLEVYLIDHDLEINSKKIVEENKRQREIWQVNIKGH